LLAAGMAEFAFAAVLADQRMLLLAGARLAAVAHDVLPPGFEARLAEAHPQARRGALLFAAAAGHLADALEAARIPAVELKGATLAADLHVDEALRAYTDIDLLDPAESLERATAIAGSLGWTARVDPSGPALPPLHLALRHPQGALPEVELHWYKPRFAAAALARSRVVDDMRSLEPVDQLAALLFHVRDGFAGLRLAPDLGAWWDRHGDAATPAALERLGQAHPELEGAWRVTLTTVAPVVGLPARGGALRAAPAQPARRRGLAPPQLGPARRHQPGARQRHPRRWPADAPPRPGRSLGAMCSCPHPT
jgi:hypothetical protein